MLHGITVTLYSVTQSGTDDFNRPILAETPVSVSDVLVAPIGDQEIREILELTGRKAVYQLGIPKGDNHDWANRKVSFFGETFRAIGIPTEGIEDMIPLRWNRKVRVERIE